MERFGDDAKRLSMKMTAKSELQFKNLPITAKFMIQSKELNVETKTARIDPKTCSRHISLFCGEFFTSNCFNRRMHEIVNCQTNKTCF